MRRQDLGQGEAAPQYSLILDEARVEQALLARVRTDSRYLQPGDEIDVGPDGDVWRVRRVEYAGAGAPLIPSGCALEHYRAYVSQAR